MHSASDRLNKSSDLAHLQYSMSSLDIGLPSQSAAMMSPSINESNAPAAGSNDPSLPPSFQVGMLSSSYFGSASSSCSTATYTTTTATSAACTTNVSSPAPSLMSSSSSLSESSSSSSSHPRHIIIKRQLRAGRSSERNVHSINRRTITKPKKNFVSLLSGSTEAEIRKIYTCKKLGTVKATALETIYEETTSNITDGDHGGLINSRDVGNNDDAAADDNDSLLSQVNFIGLKKLKRSLSFSDGSSANKTTVMKRKRQIKKFMGNYKKAKKLSMADFLNKLHAMNQNSSTEGGGGNVPPPTSHDEFNALMGNRSNATDANNKAVDNINNIGDDAVDDEEEDDEKERAKSDTEC